MGPRNGHRPQNQGVFFAPSDAFFDDFCPFSSQNGLFIYRNSFLCVLFQFLGKGGWRHEGVKPDAANDGHGTIYAIAENLSSDYKTIRQRLVSHEIVGHDGLRQLLGKNYGKMLDSVLQRHLAEVMDVNRKYGFDMKTEKGRRAATEEWLSSIADIDNPPSWFKQLIAKIRATLRTMFNVEWSDDDIRAAISQAGKRMMAEGQESRIKFSLQELPNGEKYVEVDTDQKRFEGLDAQKAARLARTIILEKFRNKIIGIYK